MPEPDSITEGRPALPVFDELHHAVDRSLAGLYVSWGISAGLPSPVVVATHIEGDLRRAGWRPPARVIETWAVSADLPSDAIVTDAGGSLWQRHGEGWYRLAKSRPDAPEGMPHPVTVVWQPEVSE